MLNININFDETNPEDVTVICGKTIISITTTNDDKVVIEDDPNKRYGIFNTYTFNTTEDVDNFCNRFNHANNYTDSNGVKLSLGDKIFIKDGKYNTHWLVAGFDCEYDRIASDGTKYDNGYGIFLIPETIIDILIWNIDGHVYDGYKNSSIHRFINNYVCNTIKLLLNNHLIQRNVLLSNSVNNCKWTKAYMTIMSLSQMTYEIKQSFSCYNDGEANYKLPLFDFAQIQVPNGWFWLRSINDDKYAWSINYNGDAEQGYVDNARGVRPLMMIR